MSIQVSSSLRHYISDKVHGLNLFSSSWCRVTIEHFWSVVCGHAVEWGVIHPCHTWSMPHITLIKQLYISNCIVILPPLHHYWQERFNLLVSNIQGNSWACLWCSWKSCGGLRGDPSLSDIVHASYNTHKTVGCHIYMCAIILVSLYHWWGVMVQDLGSSNIQGISWVYHWCSWRSCRSLQGDPPLTDVVYASYNTYKTVVYHIHQCIINLGPLWLQH